ncbi:hypothetical protein BRC93_09005 [Halobacteriales archaeon QS_5_70_15]|nr:MAG: hypothetical protein BRC93_09005 [Halobacteriales archaeon QS_5_70_15]
MSDGLHGETGVFDAHADLLYTVVREHDLGNDRVIEDRFLPGMRAGGIDMRVAPIYLDAGEAREGATRRGLRIAESFHHEVEAAENLEAATTAEAVRAGVGSDPVTLVLGMEGAEPLKGDPAVLDAFYRLGLRVLGLTHSRRNMSRRPCGRAVCRTRYRRRRLPPQRTGLPGRGRVRGRPVRRVPFELSGAPGPSAEPPRRADPGGRRQRRGRGDKRARGVPPRGRTRRRDRRRPCRTRDRGRRRRPRRTRLRLLRVQPRVHVPCRAGVHDRRLDRRRPRERRRGAEHHACAPRARLRPRGGQQDPQTELRARSGIGPRVTGTTGRPSPTLPSVRHPPVGTVSTGRRRPVTNLQRVAVVRTDVYDAVRAIRRRLSSRVRPVGSPFYERAVPVVDEAVGRQCSALSASRSARVKVARPTRPDYWTARDVVLRGGTPSEPSLHRGYDLTACAPRYGGRR